MVESCAIQPRKTPQGKQKQNKSVALRFGVVDPSNLKLFSFPGADEIWATIIGQHLGALDVINLALVSQAGHRIAHQIKLKKATTASVPELVEGLGSLEKNLKLAAEKWGESIPLAIKLDFQAPHMMSYLQATQVQMAELLNTSCFASVLEIRSISLTQSDGFLKQQFSNPGNMIGHLKSLSIQNSDVLFEGGRELTVGLLNRCSTTLQHFSIQACREFGMDDDTVDSDVPESLSEIIVAVSKCKSLLSLTLTGFSLGSQGCLLISNVLRQNTQCKSICLADNNIQEWGDLLGCTPSLTFNELDISNNPLSRDSALSLLSLLHSHKHLTSLRISPDMKRMLVQCGNSTHVGQRLLVTDLDW